MHKILKNLMGAFTLFVGGSNFVRLINEAIQGRECNWIAAFVMLTIFVLGLVIIFTSKVSLWICAFIGTACIGLAIWMPVVVYMNDGNWSIYGDFAPIFHMLMVVIGLYNATVAIMGYRFFKNRRS